MADADVRVEGLEALLAKCRDDAILQQPVRRFFGRATLDIKGRAMADAPVDQGDLRRRHATSIDPAPLPHWGKVGVSGPHALYVHGAMNETKARSRPHWPPMAAIAGWARRHGIAPFLVARSIARKGTPLNPWLRRAFEARQGAVRGYLADAAGEIEDRWRR